MKNGEAVDEALQIKNTEIVKELALPPVKNFHCLVLAEDAIRAAISDWKKEEQEAPVTSVSRLVAFKWVQEPLCRSSNGTDTREDPHGQGRPGHRRSPGPDPDGDRQGRHLARAGRIAPGGAGRR